MGKTSAVKKNQVPGRLPQLQPFRVAITATLMGAYIILLQQAYQYLIAPRFSYLGFTFRDPTWSNYSVVIIIVLALAVVMPRRFDLPSSTILWLHFLIATAPSMLIPQNAAIIRSSEGFTFAIGIGLAWALVIMLMSPRVWPRNMSPIRVPVQAGVWPVLTGISLVCLLYVFLFVGLVPRFVSLTDVISVRFNYRRVLGENSSVLAYLILLASNVVNPALIARGYVAKRRDSMVLGIVGQVMIYSITGYKMVLLSVPTIVLMCWILRRRENVSSTWLLTGIVTVMGVSVAADIIFGATTLTLLFVMRFLVVPGNLSSAYVSIFGPLPELGWSYSFMSWASDYPYSLNPNFLVGSIFRGSAESSANVNLFADGYMNLRWLGIAIECLLLVVMLRLVDRASLGLPVVLATAICLVPTIALTNSSVFTSITTHGFGAAIIVLAALPRAWLGPGSEGFDGAPSGFQRSSGRRDWSQRESLAN